MSQPGNPPRKLRVRRWRRRPDDMPVRKRRYRADRSVRGVVAICVSLPPSVAAGALAEARRRGVSRSHLIRIALERVMEQECEK